MGHTCNSIVIDAPYDLVFDISNDITRWTELFGEEYKKSEVLSKEGNEITFRLTDEDDKVWVSKRWLFKEQKFAFATRHDPMFPFEYMKIIWLYNEQADGVQMTWIQDFRMDEKFTKFNDEKICEFINEGSRHNMQIFKEIIEKESKS